MKYFNSPSKKIIKKVPITIHNPILLQIEDFWSSFGPHDTIGAGLVFHISLLPIVEGNKKKQDPPKGQNIENETSECTF